MIIMKKKYKKLIVNIIRLFLIICIIILDIIYIQSLLFLLAIIIVVSFLLIKSAWIKNSFIIFLLIIFLMNYIYQEYNIYYIFLQIFRYSSIIVKLSNNLLFFLYFIIISIFGLIYIFERKDKYIKLNLIIPIIVLLIDIIYLYISNENLINILLQTIHNFSIYYFFYYFILYIDISSIYFANKIFEFFIDYSGFKIKVKHEKIEIKK